MCKGINSNCSKTVIESGEMVGNPLSHSKMGNLLDAKIQEGKIKEKYGQDEKYSKGKRVRDGVNVGRNGFTTLPGLWMRGDSAQVSWKDENSIKASCDSSWDEMRRYCPCEN